MKLNIMNEENMRLWSLNPSYLDSKGLVALWREGLLAQKVLLGNTIGYKNHPQLQRFKNTKNSLDAISTFLQYIAIEADIRNFRFNKSKIIGGGTVPKLPITNGQLEYEFSHLLNKLKIRDEKQYVKIKDIVTIKTHPLFYMINGEIESWEVT